ncbi:MULTISPECIES: DMT family transporter [Clostridium]|uniref:Transporter family-2 protein n=1 Tax=Clostridium intestinale DSM 6191 TaxID=1121320 RepID=A0A1M5ZQ37_9CLOT|nr:MULTISPECIES: DMT family transporter [Clostridium]SHI26301.1 transporter family-2 protein [Clostridium intestinale DSM 6191]
MYKIYSALIGILITIMIVFNGKLSSSLGNYTAIIIIHLTGLIAMIIWVIVKKQKISFDKNIPLYIYSAGLIGIFTVLFTNMSFNYLGASLTLSLGLLGQSVASILIDHYGFLGAEVVKFNKQKLIGLIAISLGIFIMSVY